MSWRVLLFFCAFVGVSARGVTSNICKETLLRFSHFAETTDEIGNSKRLARLLVSDQARYLYGAMSNSKVKGVPIGKPKIEIESIERLSDSMTRVQFHYQGKILLQNGPRRHYKFYLPRDPSEEGIYDPAVDPKSGINLATDDHYNDFGNYWYFWEPKRKGSPLKQGVHFDEVQGQIRRLNNTTRSYPEYERLVDPRTGDIPITLFFGMDKEEHVRNPIKGREFGAYGYRGARAHLINLGFVPEAVSSLELRNILDLQRVPYSKFTFERFVKQTSKARLVADMFYGPTGLIENSRAFHYFYKNALEKSSIVIYDGHTGFEENIELNLIEEAEGFKIKKKPQKYQILFLNGCSSFPFFNDSYRVLKGRRYATKSLDLMANGLPTSFDSDQHATKAFLEAVNLWATQGKKTSYQTLAKRIEQFTFLGETNLFTVGGDQDNPTVR